MGGGLLALVGLGFLAFGLLELASARYRRIRVDADVFETVSL